MSETKHRLEFFPEVIFTIPKAPGGSCCLKPVPKQTDRSREMYRFAKSLQWKNKDKLELLIPSKSESRVRVLVKWRKFLARMRLRRLRIKTLPALALDGKVLCQGKLTFEKDIDLAI
ncbi:MAG: hypothetical protein V3U20_04495 [Thermoplasmata archaeon]